MEEVVKAINELGQSKPLKIVISNRKNKDVKYNKINILLKEKNQKEFSNASR